MAMNKNYEALNKKSEVELEQELAKTRFELVKLSAQLNTGGAAKEAGKVRQLKVKIARIKTARSHQHKKGGM